MILYVIAYYVAIAINFAILIGTPLAYVAACLWLGRTIPGKAGSVAAVLLIAVPAGWMIAMYANFASQCEGREISYHRRDTGVDGILAVGDWAQHALREDVGSEDGYLFYEFERQGQIVRVDPSGKQESVPQKRSRYAFEISEPRALNAPMYLHESKFQIRDTDKGIVIAEGSDLLLEGYLLERLHQTRYGNRYLACGPGVRDGGWRQGVTAAATSPDGNPYILRKQQSQEMYAKRDREFLRSALIPARSAATLQPTLDELARVESPLSFQNTLWQLVSKIRKDDSYNEPTLFFRGEVPVAHLDPATASQVLQRARDSMGEKDVGSDPDVAGATFWVNVLYSPKGHHPSMEIPRIRVIQKAGAVIVKAVPLRNTGEVLGTETLDHRRKLQRDMNQLVRSAVAQPVPHAGTAASELASSFTYHDTIQRLLDRIAAEADYRVDSQWEVTSLYRGGGKAQRVAFARKDGQLMARVFSFDAHSYGSTRLYVDVIDRNGTIAVSLADVKKLLPGGLSPEIAAGYRQEVQDLVAKAIEGK